MWHTYNKDSQVNGFTKKYYFKTVQLLTTISCERIYHTILFVFTIGNDIYHYLPNEEIIFNNNS